MPDTPATTADILNRAADLIETYGHHKGDYGDEIVGFCMTGAIFQANGAKFGRRLRATRALNHFLGMSPEVLNDTPNFGKASAIALLRAAAADAPAKEVAEATAKGRWPAWIRAAVTPATWRSAPIWDAEA